MADHGIFHAALNDYFKGVAPAFTLSQVVCEQVYDGDDYQKSSAIVEGYQGITDSNITKRRYKLLFVSGNLVHRLIEKVEW